MSEWWVGRRGANPVGPVSTDTLVRGIVEKKVPEDALVCRVGENEWQHLAQVEELWELAHPEDFRTNITKKPWFADKADSAPPVLREADADDESTRILGVPILPMRTIDVEAKPPAGTQGPPIVAERPPAHTSHGAPGVAPTRAAAQPAASAPAAAKAGLAPAPVASSAAASAPAAAKAGLAPSLGASAPAAAKAGIAPAPIASSPAASAPAAAKAGLAPSLGASAPAAAKAGLAPAPAFSAPAASTSPATSSAAQASSQSPRGVIAPPRFGTDRAASAPPSAAKAAPAAARPTSAAVNSPTFVAPAGGNGRADPISEPAPDSDERPSVPIMGVRPNAAAASAPAAAAVPLYSAKPKPGGAAPSEPPRPSRSEPPRPRSEPPRPQAKPVVDGLPTGKYVPKPVDYDDDTVTVIAKAPVMPRVAPASFPGAAPQTPASAPVPNAAPPPPPPPVAAPTPLMPMVVAKPPQAPPEQALPHEPSSTTKPSPVYPPQKPADHKPPVEPPPPPPPAPPPPPPPEVEPSDLFDEDFEPPPPPISKLANRATLPGDSSAPRPAAGTPVAPSVIVTQPPPSMPEIVLAHAIPHIPEETRPAVRSLRAPGTIQISLGALIIGALGLIVLVLFAVLLLR